MEFDSGSCTQEECSVNNQVRMITGHASMGRMLTSSQVALSGFCMRPSPVTRLMETLSLGRKPRYMKGKVSPAEDFWPVTPFPQLCSLQKFSLQNFKSTE